MAAPPVPDRSGRAPRGPPPAAEPAQAALVAARTARAAARCGAKALLTHPAPQQPAKVRSPRRPEARRRRRLGLLCRQNELLRCHEQERRHAERLEEEAVSREAAEVAARRRYRAERVRCTAAHACAAAGLTAIAVASLPPPDPPPPPPSPPPPASPKQDRRPAQPAQRRGHTPRAPSTPFVAGGRFRPPRASVPAPPTPGRSPRPPPAKHWVEQPNCLEDLLRWGDEEFDGLCSPQRSARRVLASPQGQAGKRPSTCPHPGEEGSRRIWSVEACAPASPPKRVPMSSSLHAPPHLGLLKPRARAARRRRRQADLWGWTDTAETQFVSQIRRLLWRARVEYSIRDSRKEAAIVALRLMAERSLMILYWVPWRKVGQHRWGTHRERVLASRQLEKKAHLLHLALAWKRIFGKLLLLTAIRRTIHGLYRHVLHQWRAWVPIAKHERLCAKHGVEMMQMIRTSENGIMRRRWRLLCWRAFHRLEARRRRRVAAVRGAELTLNFYSKLPGRRALELLFRIASESFPSESEALYTLEYLLHSEAREARLYARKAAQAQQLAARLSTKQMRTHYRSWALFAAQRAAERHTRMLQKQQSRQRALEAVLDLELRSNITLRERYWRKLLERSENKPQSPRRRAANIRSALDAAAGSGACVVAVAAALVPHSTHAAVTAAAVSIITTSAVHVLSDPYCACHGLPRLLCTDHLEAAGK